MGRLKPKRQSRATRAGSPAAAFTHQPTIQRFAFQAMGSPCELQIETAGTRASAVADTVIAEVRRLEARYSRYRADSFLSEINRVAAAGGAIDVDPETAGLLDYSEACFHESEGRFDITSGLLRKAWRFQGGGLPDAALIESLLAHVGWSRLRWQKPRLEFPEPGLELDLGGVVKEFAADRAATLLVEAGLPHAMVNLGGDIRVAGPRADGSAWRIGVRDPRTPDGLLHTVRLQRGAITTSGDYERCMVVDGVRYGHVLDPRTGWPVRGLASVTVVADFCVVAGSASTIAMLHEGRASEWLSALGLAHLWVTTDGEVGGSLAPKPPNL
ncbi:MAG: FAD:protein FMN transferase [Candidatus Eisenbacteria bacterium]